MGGLHGNMLGDEARLTDRSETGNKWGLTDGSDVALATVGALDEALLGVPDGSELHVKDRSPEEVELGEIKGCERGPNKNAVEQDETSKQDDREVLDDNTALRLLLQTEHVEWP
uniref:Uncharacterized protein n=1 Tax=Pseudictyota dubia TaxID=2749911 RepID=A0A7R9VEU8_9STRA